VPVKQPGRVVSRSPEERDEHIAGVVAGMSVGQKVLQLCLTTPWDAQRLFGSEIRTLVASGLGFLMTGPHSLENPREIAEWQQLAIDEGQVPPALCVDGSRGVAIAPPSEFTSANAWDVGLVEAVAQSTGEDLATYLADLNFGPVADCALNIRQGRGQEGAAIRSPRYAAAYVAAMARGIGLSVGVCGKHFGPYQANEAPGPDYTSAELSLRAYREDVLPRWGKMFGLGIDAVMMSFSKFRGLPSHASPFLRDLIQECAGRDCLVVSDHSGVRELVNYGIAGNFQRAVYKAFVDGGIDICLPGDPYHLYLPALIRTEHNPDGVIPEEMLDARVAKVLRWKDRRGLLRMRSPVARPDAAHALTRMERPSHRALARKSITLLTPRKLDAPAIPLDAKLLVVGYIADDAVGNLGHWAGYATEIAEGRDAVVTPLAGLRRVYPNVRYAKGFGYTEFDPSFDDALEAARNWATHVLVMCGEDRFASGEGGALARPVLPLGQVEAVEAIRGATDAVMIATITAGRPLNAPQRIQAATQALIWLGQLGTFAGDALAAVLAGHENFAGRLAYPLFRYPEVEGDFWWRRRLGRPDIPVSHLAYDWQHPIRDPSDTTPGWDAQWRDLPPSVPFHRYYTEFSMGHGGSYTEFAISQRRTSGAVLSVSEPNASLEVSCVVRNIGRMRGSTVVFLFYHDVETETVQQATIHLADQRVELGPGETEKLCFTVRAGDLAQLGVDLDEGWRARPDAFPMYLLLVFDEQEAMEALFRLAHPDPSERRSEVAVPFSLIE
jgi:beta-glucosidase-like glycosyl hydrolase